MSQGSDVVLDRQATCVSGKVNGRVARGRCCWPTQSAGGVAVGAGEEVFTMLGTLFGEGS